MALADTARLVVQLDLKGNASRGLANLDRQLAGLNRGGLRQMGRGIGQIGSGLSQLGDRAALAAAGGLAAVVTTAASFESAFAGVAKTVDATDLELDRLEEEFRALAREIPLSFEELAAIGEQGGALGIAKEDLIDFTTVVAQLAATTDLTAESAATSLGQLQNVLGLTSDDLDNFGAALVDLGNKGASTESAIVEIAARAGAAGDLIGLSADEVLGFGSAIANLGIEAEAGGTSLQTFFLKTLKNIQDDDTLEVMAETAGTTGAAFKQAFEKDASRALETFITGLGKLEEAEQLAVLAALGFKDVRITRSLLGLAGDTDNLADSLDTAAEGWRENTALSEEFAKRQETVAAQWQVFKNNARDALNTVGVELLPVASDALRDFVGFLNEPGTQSGLKDFAKDLAGGIRSLVDELKGTDFSGIIGGIKIAAEVAKGAFDAFRALPQPIQQLAIAALVANKVSGGAIGQIAAGLGNLVLGSLKTITAANVTVIGGSVTGGPGVGGGGGGGVVGGLKTVGALAAIPLVGVAAVEVQNFQDMRTDATSNLEALLDKLPRRTGDEIETSIAKIESELNDHRPLLEGVLFNTNVAPILRDELEELEEVQREQARSTAAARDAIPWLQRNRDEIRNFNQSEGTRWGQTIEQSRTQTQRQAEALAAARAGNDHLYAIRLKKSNVTVQFNSQTNVAISAALVAQGIHSINSTITGNQQIDEILT
jgi:TP901 family phage tail tape measure protein